MANELTLHFCHSHNCSACEGARPALADFARKHPDILVNEKNCALFPWKPGGVEVKSTPTYVLTDAGGAKLGKEHIGALTLKELERFVTTNAGKGNH